MKNNKAVTSTPGHRLMTVRKDIGMNQRAFSRYIDTTQNYISLLEKGKRDLSYKFANKIAVKCGISADWLLTGKGEKKPVNKDNEVIEHLKRENEQLKRENAILNRALSIIETAKR